MRKENLILGFISLLITTAIAGGYFFPKIPASRDVASSATGTTFNTMKFAGTVISLATPGSNGTSTSILNGDSFTRYVKTWSVACSGVGTSQTAYTGAGLAALLVSVGTTTTSAPASFSSNIPIASNYTVATGSVNLLISSSTVQTGVMNSTIWPSGSYLTFFFNATNTAACTVGAEYFGS